MRIFALSGFAAAIAIAGALSAHANGTPTDALPTRVSTSAAGGSPECGSLQGPWLPGTLEIVERSPAASGQGEDQMPEGAPPPSECALV